jgi:hypothetical protein
MRLQTQLSLPLLELFGLLTGHSIGAMEQKLLIHRRLRDYYRRVRETGIRVSDMSIAYPGNRRGRA